MSSEPPEVEPIGIERIDYDEFGLFHENIAEYDLDVSARPVVRRVETAVSAEPDGGSSRTVSALRWGDDDVAIVCLHGGAQNAHTWDTVALTLDQPLLAVDLPGHGHSEFRSDGAYSPPSLADDVAVVVAEHAPRAAVVVGMSLGGLTAMELAVRHPTLVRSLVMVDITPGVNSEKTKAVTDFVGGPQSFARFDDLLARTIEHNPTRSESSLRRGILHNAHQLADGSWEWRYDRMDHARPAPDPHEATDQNTEGPAAEAGAGWTAGMWEHFSSIGVPMMLVRGSLSPVVDDDDVAESRRRQPDIDVQVVDGAGHSVQGDRPLELAALLDALVTGG
ncbi:MAG: alpha/beta hydrolase [Acidimicrobiia bacterium]|nr:alpha/beta hydrolase [Acidimicrobiia bacterium]